MMKYMAAKKRTRVKRRAKRTTAKPVNIRKAFKKTRKTSGGTGKVMQAVGKMLLNPKKVKVHSRKDVRIGRFAK